MAYGGRKNTNMMSDETFDFLCRLCKRKGKNQEAEKYCLECDAYFCLKCVKLHEDVPTQRGHKILDKAQFPSTSIGAQHTGKLGSSSNFHSLAPTERCDRHSHHYTDMYCQTHDDVGCGTCIAVDHRLCQGVFYIPDFLQNNPSSSNTNKIQQSLGSTIISLKVQCETLASEKQNLLKRKAMSFEEIRKFRKEINDRLDELEESTLNVIENRYKILVNKIEEEMKLLDKQKAVLRSARDKLATTDNNISQDFVNAIKAKCINRSAAKCLEDKHALLKTKDIEFAVDKKILELLQEMNALGEMRERCTEATGVNEHREKQTDKKKNPAASIPDKKESFLQVNGSTRYSVRVNSDRSSCHIVSACTMEDGTIILCDWLNKKLKHLDSSRFTVTDCCNMPAEPYQVCPISRKQVAVSLPGKNQVNFLAISNRMTITNNITTHFECYGLAYAAGKIYISDLNSSVYVYSVKGMELMQFSKDHSGQAMFSDISSLNVNKEGSRIYVTDFSKGLIVLDRHGQVVGQFNSLLLRFANSSCLTASDSLLVCGFYSKNVLQFGLNGDLIGEVVKNDHEIKTVCCNQQMTKMIIAGDNYHKNDEIEVYDLA